VLKSLVFTAAIIPGRCHCAEHVSFVGYSEASPLITAARNAEILGSSTISYKKRIILAEAETELPFRRSFQSYL